MKAQAQDWNVTKDGREIGVVAAARGPGWYEAGGVARMSVAKFVRAARATGGPHSDISMIEGGGWNR